MCTPDGTPMSMTAGAMYHLPYFASIFALAGKWEDEAWERWVEKFLEGLSFVCGFTRFSRNKVFVGRLEQEKWTAYKYCEWNAEFEFECDASLSNYNPIVITIGSNF